MDYEKKYKEALERAKKLMVGFEGYDANVEIIKNIFPELRESEDKDERMLKKIISYLEMIKMGCVICTIDTSEEIAWLEKQQESLHVQETCKENADSFTDEDEKLRKLVIDRIRTATEMTEGLRELLLDYLEKKKEPENTSASTMAPSCREVEQKEHKPAEWSEEDEKIIQSLILEFNKYVFFAGIEANKIIGFLKSLRPSWKPSEEHLSALLAVFNDPDNIGSQTCQLALTDLYEHLKRYQHG